MVCDLFERYLRLAHGITAIRHVTGQDRTVVIVEQHAAAIPTTTTAALTATA